VTSPQPGSTGPASGRSSSTAPALSDRAFRLAAVLEDWPRRTVTIEELWGLWDQADPHSAASHERRSRLAAALTELTAAQLTRPSAAAADAGKPKLPRRITLPAAEPSQSAAEATRAVAWRPELAWVPSARLTVAQVEHLRRINVWLREHGHETDEIPLRERSLQVLGHEKTLDRLIRTGLFTPGRLDLALLRTFRTKPPLPVSQVGAGPVLLVVENDNTFHSLRTVLAESPGRVGLVAWGAGGAFEASVRSVPDLDQVTEIRYFGDIDADGLRIPRNAAAVAASEGLPSVRSADELYRRLIASDVRQPGQPPVEPDLALHLAGWLGAELSAPVRDLLTSGERIPQEALTLEALCGDTSWVRLL
jgi:Uncharacterized protein conserved in bacteria C-term(DUF2220)